MKTKKTYMIFSVIILTCIFSAPHALALKADSADIKPMAKDNNAFAIDLYQALRTQEGNLFFSPYSISTALAMTYAGARGETEKQMAAVLHFQLPQERLHNAMNMLKAQILWRGREDSYQMNIANALWVQKGFELLKGYIDTTNKYYEAALFFADFISNAKAQRLKINAWVEQQTQNKIRDLIQPGLLGSLTRLVLVNAIYFKGDWEEPFAADLTKKDKFWLAADESTVTPMMRQTEHFNYAEDEDVQVLEMFYQGYDLSMIVILPKQKDDLDSLEGMLTQNRLDEWIEQLESKNVYVIFPKFTMTQGLMLSQTLKSMGMTDVFSGMKADFSGMNGTLDIEKRLFINQVIHKAYVDVDEQGTEAAAATGVFMGDGFFPGIPEKPVLFRADHPFLFLIRDVESGSILFLGRLTNPNQ
ncbi:MAG: serpin family protein [Candidatus Omnitrophota bacterium]